MIYINKIKSPIGYLTAASDGDSLIGLWIRGQKHYMHGLEKIQYEFSPLPIFLELSEWLDAYFSGGNPDPWSLALEPRGSSFAREIWSMLLNIPYGETKTYGKLAAEYAKRHGLKSMSSQAVGGAVGHNPISIIIPCHRVIGTKGQLTGYAGGLEIKRKLLLLEQDGGKAITEVMCCEEQSTVCP